MHARQLPSFSSIRPSATCSVKQTLIRQAHLQPHHLQREELIRETARPPDRQQFPQDRPFATECALVSGFAMNTHISPRPPSLCVSLPLCLCLSLSLCLCLSVGLSVCLSLSLSLRACVYALGIVYTDRILRLKILLLLYLPRS